MTITPEQREAAERETTRLLKTLSTAFIELCGEEGEEPVTEEWLRSIGFQKTRDGCLFMEDMEGYLRYHEMPGEEPHFDWKLEPPCSKLLAVLFTRSDVLALLRALKIEVKQ